MANQMRVSRATYTGRAAQEPSTGRQQTEGEARWASGEGFRGYRMKLGEGQTHESGAILGTPSDHRFLSGSSNTSKIQSDDPNATFWEGVLVMGAGINANRYQPILHVGSSCARRALAVPYAGPGGARSRQEDMLRWGIPRALEEAVAQHCWEADRMVKPGDIHFVPTRSWPPTGVNTCGPLLTEAWAGTGLEDLEATRRACHTSAAWCISLPEHTRAPLDPTASLVHFSSEQTRAPLDPTASLVHFSSEQTRAPLDPMASLVHFSSEQTRAPAAAQSGAEAGGRLHSDGLTEPRSLWGGAGVLDSVQWLGAVYRELESVVRAEGALEMLQPGDAPASVHFLDAPSVLTGKLDRPPG
ncbi:hypothetical protein CYMTET_26920 [Cymbomonas tetramitiformis]|uniref:Uncharacterized protein n=1 Tax=Cymbomonas tetramitiformis TaxID=36881 RepID=A0AAE0FQT8_9CHLO|nr:hypothetical protein CYMTET_26920 [Cymbomonas tetramitiformis]